MRKKATREEVERLKRDWASDPIFEITGAEGFEEYEEELLAYRNEMEGRWAKERLAKNKWDAERMGVDADSKLFWYILNLESRIIEQEKRIEKLEDQVYHLKIGGRRYGPL